MRCTGHWMRCQHEIRNWEPAWSSGLLNFGEKCGAIRNCQCQPADKGRAGAASSLGNSRLVTDKVENTRGHGSRCRHASSDWNLILTRHQMPVSPFVRLLEWCRSVGGVNFRKFPNAGPVPRAPPLPLFPVPCSPESRRCGREPSPARSRAQLLMNDR